LEAGVTAPSREAGAGGEKRAGKEGEWERMGERGGKGEGREGCGGHLGEDRRSRMGRRGVAKIGGEAVNLPRRGGKSGRKVVWAGWRGR
jgi:hypothetical protein